MDYSQKDIDQNKVELEAKNKAITALKKHLNTVMTSINTANTSVKKCQEKCTSLENHSRRNKIRISGISEERDESWLETEETIKCPSRQAKPRLYTASQTGPPYRCRKEPRWLSSPWSKANSLLTLDWKEKELILKKAREIKPHGIFINEDVAEATLEKRREQLPRLKEVKEQGKRSHTLC